MNRMYNQLPYQQAVPNHQPIPQQMPYNLGYYPNNPQQMPPPYPLQQQARHGRNLNFRQTQSYPINSQPYMMPQGQGNNGAPQQEKKGFLSKLFRNSNKQPPAPTAQSLFSLPSDSTRSTATAASSGGILQSLVNPANLTGMLNNTQKVLQAAESIGPLVQQYGPMVKNIPSMWKMIQGFGSKDTEQEQSDHPQTNTNSVSVQTVQPQRPIQAHKIVQEPMRHQPHIKPSPPAQPKATRRYAPGESIPRLFV